MAKGPNGGPQMYRLARTYRALATGTRGPDPLFVVYRQRQSNQGVAVMTMPSRASLGLCRLLMSISTWYIHDISCACPLVIDPGVVTAARLKARVGDACLPTALSSV